MTEVPVDGEEIAGSSASLRAMQKMIDRLADSAATVLILGESGTGKSFVAHAIHRRGKRSDKPFVALNCAEVPSELLDVKLFGHARRVSPASASDHLGAFREADGGTLFVDEIGAMPLPLQSQLLQALQVRAITPLGGESVAIDVRVIAATSDDLELAVVQGRFREDLFDWRGLVLVHLPPLRERLADILPMAEHFLALAAGRKPPKSLSVEAAQRLLAHDWPGNLRELRDALERASSVVRQPVLNALAFDFLTGRRSDCELEPLTGDLPTAVARLETAMIRRALVESGGNRSEAAHRLGITRQLLYTKMRNYGLYLAEIEAVADPNSGRSDMRN